MEKKLKEACDVKFSHFIGHFVLMVLCFVGCGFFYGLGLSVGDKLIFGNYLLGWIFVTSAIVIATLSYVASRITTDVKDLERDIKKINKEIKKQ